MELECQLAELKSSNPHAKQGNSMFGEVNIILVPITFPCFRLQMNIESLKTI